MRLRTSPQARWLQAGSGDCETWKLWQLALAIHTDMQPMDVITRHDRGIHDESVSAYLAQARL